MKQYRVKERLTLFATDDLSQYTLCCLPGALILSCESCGLPFAQTTIRERIMLEDLQAVADDLEEVEVTTLKDVGTHNVDNNRTFRVYFKR